MSADAFIALTAPCLFAGFTLAVLFMFFTGMALGIINFVRDMLG